MALPFLPGDHITPAFDAIVASLPNSLDPRLAKVIDYMQRQWINHRLWTPSTWTAYRETVRTNNDVEGWHHRLNKRAQRGNLDVYQLAPLLHAEARFVELQVSLVSEERLRRFQRRRFTNLQGRLAKYWREYEKKKISVSRLLRRCSRIYAPV